MFKQSIGQVAEKLKVPVHTVRFWTNQFEHIQRYCIVGAGGRRYYDSRAFEELQKLKAMLYGDGMTLSGVKQTVKYGKIQPIDCNEQLFTNSAMMEKKIFDILKKITTIETLLKNND